MNRRLFFRALAGLAALAAAPLAWAGISKKKPEHQIEWMWKSPFFGFSVNLDKEPIGEWRTISLEARIRKVSDSEVQVDWSRTACGPEPDYLHWRNYTDSYTPKAQKDFVKFRDEMQAAFDDFADWTPPVA